MKKNYVVCKKKVERLLMIIISRQEYVTKYIVRFFNELSNSHTKRISRAIPFEGASKRNNNLLKITYTYMYCLETTIVTKLDLEPLTNIISH